MSAPGFDLTVAEARELLPVRPGACVAEVMSAYRTAIKQRRPDLAGNTTGEEMAHLQEARQVLMANAGPDRRRNPRVKGQVIPMRRVLPLRRSTWVQRAPRRPENFDVDI